MTPQDDSTTSGGWWSISPVARTLGMKVISADPEEGRVELTFEPTDDFINGHGHIQGGIIAAMLDATMGPALRITLDEGQWAPNTDINVRFLAPTRPGILTGRATVTRKGRTVAFTAAELFDAQGALLATATATAILRSGAQGD